jgi:hypothetical protein
MLTITRVAQAALGLTRLDQIFVDAAGCFTVVTPNGTAKGRP